jgi:hypothetical protein
MLWLLNLALGGGDERKKVVIKGRIETTVTIKGRLV